MNRRRFSIATMALAVLQLSFRDRPDGFSRVLSTLELELQSLFSVPQHAVEIGERYLRLHPEKRDRRVLIEDLVGTSWPLAGRRGSLADVESQWQERDFRNGVVVELDGWILARTEVSLCALLCLNRMT